MYHHQIKPTNDLESKYRQAELAGNSKEADAIWREIEKEKNTKKHFVFLEIALDNRVNSA